MTDTTWLWVNVTHVAVPDVLWIWGHMVRPAWASFGSAPLVWAAYWRLGRGDRRGWWLTIASQWGLVAIAVLAGQLGLFLIVPVTVWRAVQGWRQWGRPHPEIARLRAELAAAQACIAELTGAPA